MLDQNAEGIICPSCKKSFFPEEKVIQKVFCGEETVCSPPIENFNAPDCEVYSFCSVQCLEKFEISLPACTIVPRWKRLMKKISDTSTKEGLAGIRPHYLSKSGQ